jgi:hypothetical protein
MSTIKSVNQKSVSRGRELQLEMLLEGLATYPAEVINVGGVAYTKETFAERVRQELEGFKAVREARLALAKALDERKERDKETSRFVANTRHAVQGALGDQNPELEKWGFKVRKERAPETVEEKLARVAKAKKTRAERGT